MVLTKTEFNQAMQEINDSFSALYNRVTKMESELEETRSALNTLRNSEASKPARKKAA